MGFLLERYKERDRKIAQGKYPELTLKRENPIKWEVLFEKLAGLVENSRESAKHISASPSTRDFGECVFALFTPEGDSVVFSRGLLIHTLSIGSAIKWMIRNDYEEDPGFAPGDYFFNNDPYIGGAHSPDQLITTPIFYDGKIVGWSGGLTHCLETGASEPGGMPPSASNRFEEGLYMPCVKIVEREKIKRDLEVMVIQGTRDPVWWLLDNRAKIAGSRLIRDGVISLIREYGLDYYLQAIYEYIEDARHASSEKIRRVLFPGRYRGVTFYDVPYADKPVRIPRDYLIHLPIELTVSTDGHLKVDLSGASKPGFHPNNATRPCTEGNLLSAITQFLFYDVKYNQGISQIYSLEVPFNSVFYPPNQTYATSAWFSALIAFGAPFVTNLGRAYYAMGFREEVCSSQAAISGVLTGGVNQYGRNFAALVFELAAAGMAASAAMDGLDTCYGIFNPEGEMTDTEVHEQVVPQVWLGRRIWRDSGGFGKHVGGNGIESLYFVEHTDICEMGSIGCSDRVFSAPGIMGGYPAAANYRYIVLNTDLKERIEKRKPLPHSEGEDPSHPEWENLIKGTTIRTDGQTISRRMNKYDLYQQLTQAGAGFGDPLEREPRRLQEQLEKGTLTLRAAQKVFGLLVKKNTLKVDEEGTKTQRDKMRQERLKRGMPAERYISLQRERILKGDLPPMPRQMLNEIMESTPQFAQEYREFWRLPKEFCQIPSKEKEG